MNQQRNTLDKLAGELVVLLSPLDDLKPETAPRFFGELGLVLNDAQAVSLAPVLAKLGSAMAKLNNLNFDLQVSVEAGQGDAVIQKRTVVLQQIGSLIAGFKDLRNALSVLGIPNADEILPDLPRRIFNLLLVSYLERSPGVNQVLEFTGILERTDHNVEVFDPGRPFYTTNEFHYERISEWLSNPFGQLADLYDWGKNIFDGKKMFAVLDRVMVELGLPTLYDSSAAQPSLDLIFAKLISRPDLNPRGIELRLSQGVSKGSIEVARQLWSLTLNLTSDAHSDTSILLQPGKVTAKPPEGIKFTGNIRATYSYLRDPSEPLRLLSIEGASSISVEEVAASVTLNVGSNGETKIEDGASLKRGKVLVSTGSSDGFIAKILGGVKVENNFDLGFGFSIKEGLYLQGSSALEIQLASHISLGPVEIQALMLSVGASGQKFPTAITVDLKADLGPLTAIVEGLGFKVDLALSSDNSGDLGPLDMRPGFQPPKGAGLNIEAGPIKGGGYLFLDPDRGEYAGALELALFEIVTIKAIGLITTKMPDGLPGFSLLILMSVEFGSGIQLGLGFTLLAVGGLLGLNRTMSLQPLTEGIRTGSINSIMFPKDVVANAPKIISDLRIVFPPFEGKFLIGPMAKIGWGTPTLISLSLGIIIEIPGNIAILGILKAAIPTEDAALILLQVNFIGAIEFDKDRLYFFAALFESRIVFLTLEGELGLLVAFGEDSNFVVSVGGFHPRFNPPPLPFPRPRRIAISLLNTSVARLRIEGYFAVTSNSVQFGARVDLFFGFDSLNVRGHLAFDVLFQFSPFYFDIEISASLSVNVFGGGLFSVDIHGMLSGPAPWHVLGHGSISILFVHIGVDFEKTWGDRRDTKLPPISVLPILQAELSKAENWRALLPAGSNLLVSLRKMPAEEAALILHPVGVLHISQRAVPLELKLDKFGNQKPNDVNRLSIAVAAGGLAKTADTHEQFAPAQFQNFADSDKLSKPAFTKELSGLDLSAAGADLRSSSMGKRVVRYQEIIIDSNYKRSQRRFRPFMAALFNFFLNGAAVTRCDLSRAIKTKLQPFDEKIDVLSETYTVALQSNNQALSPEATSFHSEASARDYMNRKIAEDASLVDRIHVIPSFERAA